MLHDVHLHDDPKPFVMGNKIGYAQNDGISYTTFHGYRTVFAYFYQYQMGAIDKEEVVRSHAAILLCCGNFSYAEIPKNFEIRMGVTGTLQSLRDTERKIIMEYDIQQLSYAPSIYGPMKREVEKVKVDLSITDWYLRIVQTCQEKQQAGRAVLVFFEDSDIMKSFEAKHGSDLRNVKTLTEETEYKNVVVKQATASGHVTLCTRPFGRGVDFVCRDVATKEKGGVHVIQTFVAGSPAEDIQIQGRTARQGNRGSYEMILLVDELVKKYSFSHDTIEKAIKDETIEQLIIENRNDAYDKSIQTMIQLKNEALNCHNYTAEFHKALQSYDGSEIQKNALTNYIKIINQRSTNPFYFFFCLDDSKSMSGQPWKDLISAVKAFLAKRIEFCKSSRVDLKDLVTIINHNSNPELMCSGHAITSKPVKKTRFRGGNNDFSACLKFVTKEIEKIDVNDYTPVLLFMSDGGCPNGEEEMKQFPKLFPDLKVFTIGFGKGCHQQKLSNMATIAGGEYYFGTDGGELKQAFEAISTRISTVKFSVGN